MAGKAHPGFKAVQNKIAAKQGVSKQAAGAILAKSTKKASPAAKKKNPALKKVAKAQKGGFKPKAPAQKMQGNINRAVRRTAPRGR